MAWPDAQRSKLPLDMKVFGVTIALAGAATLVRDFFVLAGSHALGTAVFVWAYYSAHATLAVAGWAFLARKPQTIHLLVTAVIVQYLASLGLFWRALTLPSGGSWFGWARQVCDAVLLHGLWVAFVVCYLLSSRTRMAIGGRSHTLAQADGRPALQERVPGTVKLLALLALAMVASDVLTVLYMWDLPPSPSDIEPAAWITAPVVFAVGIVLAWAALMVLAGSRGGVRLLAFALFLHAIIWAVGIAFSLLLAETKRGLDEYQALLVYILVAQGLWSLFPAAYLATVYWEHPNACEQGPTEFF